jgi:hypothetical protein
MSILFKITHDYDAVTAEELEQYFDPADPMNILNMENAKNGLNELRVTYDPPFPGYPPKPGEPLIIPKTGCYTITKKWYDLEKAQNYVAKLQTWINASESRRRLIKVDPVIIVTDE